MAKKRDDLSMSVKEARRFVDTPTELAMALIGSIVFAIIITIFIFGVLNLVDFILGNLLMFFIIIGIITIFFWIIAIASYSAGKRAERRKKRGKR